MPENRCGRVARSMKVRSPSSVAVGIHDFERRRSWRALPHVPGGRSFRADPVRAGRPREGRKVPPGGLPEPAAEAVLLPPIRATTRRPGIGVAQGAPPSRLSVVVECTAPECARIVAFQPSDGNLSCLPVGDCHPFTRRPGGTRWPASAGRQVCLPSTPEPAARRLGLSRRLGMSRRGSVALRARSAWSMQSSRIKGGGRSWMVTIRAVGGRLRANP
jgi:hypothetical protein